MDEVVDEIAEDLATIEKLSSQIAAMSCPDAETLVVFYAAHAAAGLVYFAQNSHRVLEALNHAEVPNSELANDQRMIVARLMFDCFFLAHFARNMAKARAMLEAIPDPTPSQRIMRSIWRGALMAMSFFSAVLDAGVTATKPVTCPLFRHPYESLHGRN